MDLGSKKDEKTYPVLTVSVKTICYNAQNPNERVGMGTDCRMESRKITGFALALDNRILHLSVFSQTAGQNQYVGSSRMRRYTQGEIEYIK
jgi:hypothetical protein